MKRQEEMSESAEEVKKEPRPTVHCPVMFNSTKRLIVDQYEAFKEYGFGSVQAADIKVGVILCMDHYGPDKLTLEYSSVDGKSHHHVWDIHRKTEDAKVFKACLIQDNKMIDMTAVEYGNRLAIQGPCFKMMLKALDKRAGISVCRRGKALFEQRTEAMTSAFTTIEQDMSILEPTALLEAINFSKNGAACMKFTGPRRNFEFAIEPHSNVCGVTYHPDVPEEPESFGIKAFITVHIEPPLVGNVSRMQGFVPEVLNRLLQCILCQKPVER